MGALGRQQLLYRRLGGAIGVRDGVGLGRLRSQPLGGAPEALEQDPARDPRGPFRELEVLPERAQKRARAARTTATITATVTAT